MLVAGSNKIRLGLAQVPKVECIAVAAIGPWAAGKTLKGWFDSISLKTTPKQQYQRRKEPHPPSVSLQTPTKKSIYSKTKLVRPSEVLFILPFSASSLTRPPVRPLGPGRVPLAWGTGTVRAVRAAAPAAAARCL